MTWALQVVAPCGLFLFPSSDRAFGFPDSRFGHFAPKRLLGGVCCFDSLRQPFKILGDLKHQLLRFSSFIGLARARLLSASLRQYSGSLTKLWHLRFYSAPVFCRRRHQPRRPPQAKIRPGSPAPAMGPGTLDGGGVMGHGCSALVGLAIILKCR